MSEKHDGKGEIFVIGDIHGCGSELRLMLNKLPLTPGATIVFVGDYVDRGSQSREVIDTILELRRSFHVVTLMGNHEAMFLDFLEAPRSEKAGMFIYNGGSATLASYADGRGHYLIPEEHRSFLAELQLSYQTDEYFFVHAGVPDVPIEQLDEQRHRHKMLWLRQTFHRSTFDWSKRIVHGHSPVVSVEIDERRINVDTGCVYNRFLSAIRLPQNEIYGVPRQSAPRHVYLRDPDSRRVAVRFEGAIPVYVHRGMETLEFETIDYNEFGMFLRSVAKREEPVFHVHEHIRGEIGSQDHTIVRFEGQIVRVAEEDDGICYAVQLSSPPDPPNP